MEEIMEVLKVLKKGQDEIVFGQVEMRKDIAELKAGYVKMEQNQVEMKKDIAELKAGHVKMERNQVEMRKDIAVLNKKVDTLIESDKKTQKLLEIHETKISEINQEQFEHTARINILEKKVG